MGKVLLVLLVLFSISLISAVNIGVDPSNTPSEINDIFQEDTEVDIRFTCDDSFTDLPCNSGYLCNITIWYPNNTAFINNGESSRNPSYYNYTIPSTDTRGTYSYKSYCTNGTNSGVSSLLYFKITPTGDELSTAQGIIYLLVLLLSIFVFGLSLYGAVIIPFNHPVDEEGHIIQMSSLKYVKLLLWFLSYTLVIWILFLMWNLSYGFLQLDAAANIFGAGFKFVSWIFLPVFVITTIVIGINFLTDKKLRKKLARGIRI